MSAPRPVVRVTLPSIQEMFPAELLGLSSRPVHREHSPVGPPSHPTAIPAPPAGDGSPPDDRKPDPEPSRRPSSSDEERRHVCNICGKAFNRPSSLKIHVNTHTGAKPFECPFPGCGRRFNVNSNMRRHLRNHTSPHRPFNAASPYTYPLTTAPRALYPHAGAPACAPPPSSPPSPAHSRSDASGSEEDELSDSEYAEHDQLLAAGVDRLRLRAYSASSAASSPRPPPAASPAHRPRASSYAVPAWGESASAQALHPSSRVYRPTPGG